MKRYDTTYQSPVTPAWQRHWHSVKDSVIAHTSDSDGEWVRYDDAIQAIHQAQVDMARMNREGADAVIRVKNEEIDRLTFLLNALKDRP